MVVTVPKRHLEKVRAAAFQAGAGRIGNYSGCSFTVEGVGTFRPGEGTEPSVGTVGSDEKIQESRLELTAAPGTLSAVLSGIRSAHPYEEPAIDVYPTASPDPGGGYGIVGTLPRRTTVGQLASALSLALKPASMRLVGKKGSSVKNVAVCAGSGASLLEAAVASGAQLYITGDLKYHDARKAEEAGINVLDAGHFTPEKYGFDLFGKLLAERFSRRGLKVEIGYAKEKDPFLPVP